MVLPLGFTSKKLLIDFSLFDGLTGRRLTLLQRHDRARLARQQLNYDIIYSLCSESSEYSADRLIDACRLRDDAGKILEALILSTNEEMRYLYGVHELGDDDHTAACRLRVCPDRCHIRREKATVEVLQWQLRTRYEIYGLHQRVTEDAVRPILDMVATLADRFISATMGPSLPLRGLYNPVINPLMLCVDFLKAREREFENSPDSWTRAEAQMALDQFFGDCLVYVDLMLRFDVVALQRVYDQALRFWANFFIPYVLIPITIGRPTLIKMEQVATLAPTWRERQTRTRNVRQRIDKRWDRVYQPIMEFGRFVAGGVLRGQRVRRLVGEQNVLSRHRSVSYPIVVGEARSSHFEFDSPSTTDLWQSANRTFLTIGRHRINIFDVFPYAANDSRDRQHFYSTKTETEVVRALNTAIRRGRGPSAKMLEDTRDLRICIGYRVEPLLNGFYWFGAIALVVSGLLFAGIYNPAGGVGGGLFQPALPLLSILLASLMTVRPKDNLVADMVFRRRCLALAFGGLTAALLILGLAKPLAVSRFTDRVSVAYKVVGIDLSRFR